MDETEPQLDAIEDAVAAIARGELVVVVDDLDRENEGDLIMSAAKATPENMAFMIRHTSGIICVPLTAKRAHTLNLPPMVANNIDPMRTAFTISVDYKVGMTTGIAANERAATARALANDNCGGDDFIRPGHIFPLISREGGVLVRSGHTEAGTDLASLAGLEPIGVLAEIVNDDGTVKRLAELKVFAREHGLPIISIEDLISYRVRRESFVTCAREMASTVAGHPCTIRIYETPFDAIQHVVAVFGDVADRENVPVRIHREQPVEDYFGTLGSARSWAQNAIKPIAEAGAGVLMLLRTASADEFDEPGSTGEGGEDEHHQSALVRRRRWREVGVGAQILRDLRIRSIAEIATGERTYVGLAGFGIAVAKTIIVDR
ncbi:3,4-dihydroxy-2-butanone-4-phosphate synthase [Pararhizobium mangrovi]|uniref:3,4-dihydroxy-2-butanone 4-phosphate synthase n=1 Tax=Pararhizobium mangrovi TaxID=2590452 RepID=A0A506U8M6_9HYPH|nr:3,4-dihydroxy-2-butanone-4-phosphate synthase [Pararhizobium mangrovi]TPW30703.1 3,4-dihydroxy-2-butanone-4-phosphate synthase [Pararhizobium mangrovi]